MVLSRKIHGLNYGATLFDLPKSIYYLRIRITDYSFVNPLLENIKIRNTSLRKRVSNNFSHLIMNLAEYVRCGSILAACLAAQIFVDFV